MTDTKVRTFSKVDWEASQAAWRDWDASAEMRDEWLPWQRLAREAGILWPPHGDRYDSWLEEHPSQLAILTRAIRETPQLLEAAIRSPGVHSWDVVVAVLCRGRDAIRLELDERLDAEEAAWAATKAAERAEAGAVLERIGWKRA